MKKKIILVLFICCIIVSCGKKGDPKYKDPENKTMIQTILIKRA
ncbi:hypothetical protein OA949_01605 [Candidatus Pelagibacter sp.]|nr:hypothetical protein [Candidatus Pelagibacter sp.]